MATLKQRRQRFYILVVFLILFVTFIFFPKNNNTVNITELYPIELGEQETVINKIKVSVTPFLSYNNDKLALLFIDIDRYKNPNNFIKDLNNIKYYQSLNVLILS